MRSTISISLPKEEASDMRAIAKRRGFATISAYIRYLVSESAGDVITDEEILHRSANADNLHKQKKLQKLSSLSDLMDV